jgi:hypothetical protein
MAKGQVTVYISHISPNDSDPALMRPTSLAQLKSQILFTQFTRRESQVACLTRTHEERHQGYLAWSVEVPLVQLVAVRN